MPDVILGSGSEINNLIKISDVERCSGLYILGAQGTGKTTLLKNLIFQDMKNGHGVFFLDPHGDAIADLQTRIPAHRQNDVIILDPSDEGYSFGINPLACPDPANMTARAHTFAQAIDMFRKLFANIQTEELDILLNQYLRNSFFPLIANQGYTILEIPLLLAEKPFRDRLLQHPAVRPEVARFWHTKFARMSQTDRDKETASTERRLDPFGDFDHIRHIVGQTTSTIDFFTIMQERKILFVKLSKSLPADAWRIIGTMLVSNLVHAVRQREHIPEKERRHFCIFVDEFQNFASSEDFAVLFTEARKYAIATTIAHQERYGQFADNRRISGATLTAVNKACFRLIVPDTKDLAPEFARQAPDSKTLLGGELVISPHPIEDMWERGHPEEELVYIRDRYFWIVEALRSKPQEQYLLFDRSRIKPEYLESYPFTVRFEEFDDWEWYRSSADEIRRGISLLNQYYYDWMRGKYDPATPITDAQLQLMLSVIECLGGVFGFLPMYRPYIPEPMRHALFRALQQYVPRRGAYETSKEDRKYLGSADSVSPTENYYWVGYTLRAKITASDFPRILMPYEDPVCLIAREAYQWRPGHPLSEQEFHRRLRLCRRLIGYDPIVAIGRQIQKYAGEFIGYNEGSQREVRIEDIPTTFPDMALYQGILQLARYIGMPLHELENLIAWEVQPLSREEKAALADFVTMEANRKVAPQNDETKERLYQQYALVMGKRLSEVWHKSAKVTKRLEWQMGELLFFVGMCLEGGPRWLAHWPVKLQSGRYEDAPKREKTQGEMITEMEQELNSLPNHTAYVKAGSWKGKMRQPFPADSLLGEPIVDVSSIARWSAIEARILRKREDIEAEIRERQEQWRGESGNEPPPPPSSGGNSPPSQPSGRSGQPEEPPPTSIPEKASAKNPPGNSAVAQPTTDTDENRGARHEGRIIDFTKHLVKRREKERPPHVTPEPIDTPVFRRREPRPPDVPMPSYEHLDYSKGTVSVQDFRDHLAPLVKAALFRYELLDSEPGDSLAVYFALALQDRMLGRRVLHKMLQRGGSMPYEEVGRLAILLGETALAEKLIHDLEKRNEDYSDRQAGAIAAKLPDEAEAYRLLRKFEEKGNQAAALHIAVEIGDAEAVKRVLIDIIQYGNIDATPGYFAAITESLLKAVPSFPALGKRIVLLIEKQREIANVFPQEGRQVAQRDYFISAGKIAAVLGEIKDAERAVNGCLSEADFLGAAEIAALMEEEILTEQAVSKYVEVTRDNVSTSQLGLIIATTAHHHLRVAEKMWMMVTEKFFNSTPHIAKKILDYLVSPSPFREEHTMAESTSTDPWNQLTQSMRSLSENVERLNVATEKCIRVIDDSLG